MSIGPRDRFVTKANSPNISLRQTISDTGWSNDQLDQQDLACRLHCRKQIGDDSSRAMIWPIVANVAQNVHIGDGRLRVENIMGCEIDTRAQLWSQLCFALLDGVGQVLDDEVAHFGVGFCETDTQKTG